MNMSRASTAMASRWPSPPRASVSHPLMKSPQPGQRLVDRSGAVSPQTRSEVIRTSFGPNVAWDDFDFRRGLFEYAAIVKKDPGSVDFSEAIFGCPVRRGDGNRLDKSPKSTSLTGNFDGANFCKAIFHGKYNCLESPKRLSLVTRTVLDGSFKGANFAGAKFEGVLFGRGVEFNEYTNLTEIQCLKDVCVESDRGDYEPLDNIEDFKEFVRLHGGDPDKVTLSLQQSLCVNFR